MSQKLVNRLLAVALGIIIVMFLLKYSFMLLTIMVTSTAAGFIATLALGHMTNNLFDDVFSESQLHWRSRAVTGCLSVFGGTSFLSSLALEFVIGGPFASFKFFVGTLFFTVGTVLAVWVRRRFAN